MQMQFTLPWPPKELSPNGRRHWSALASAKKRYRAACALTALSQGAMPMQAEKLVLRVVFVPPNRQRRDLDNCISSMKAGFDGLADVLKVDDSRWKLSFEMAGEVGGLVRVTVAPAHVLEVAR